MDIRKKIIFAFSFIVVLLSATGIFLIQSMQNLAKETENIYRHPFAVSNATRDIQIHLISIQNYLKDIMLAENGKESGIAQEKIRLRERMICEKFELINERFLGDKADVHKARKVFSEWVKVCEEVISLKKNGKESDVSEIMRGEFADSSARVESAIQHLADFATDKANEFYTKTLDRKMRSLVTFTSLLAVIITTSIFILFYVVKNHDLSQREINRYFHLIDQNIMIASTDRDDHIMDISNALCRFLGSTKKEMIGRKCDFFIDDDQKELSEHICRIIETGCEWKGDIKRIVHNSETRWISQTVHPVFDENFKISSYTHIIHDVTERKVLEEQSVTDKLTSLYNRRFFDDVIGKEIKLARRKGTFLTLAIMDIDFFKRYNDHYGHPAGDEVLTKVAGILKKTMKRPDDYLFRVGGEEFAVIFSATDRNNSYRFLEEIRKNIELLKIAHDYNDVSSNVTVSIGARVYKGSDIPDKNQFYIQADQCLYEAKKQRNKVVVI